MSYLFVVIIGAVAGWIAGQFLKTDDGALILDVGAGAVGAAVAVVLARMLGPAAASGFVLSAILAIAGGVVALFALRRFMHQAPVPVARRRRR